MYKNLSRYLITPQHIVLAAFNIIIFLPYRKFFLSLFICNYIGFSINGAYASNSFYQNFEPDDYNNLIIPSYVNEAWTESTPQKFSFVSKYKNYLLNSLKNFKDSLTTEIRYTSPKNNQTDSFSKTFEKSLSNKNNGIPLKDTTESFRYYINKCQSIVKKGFSYAYNHPVEALALGLASQITAVSAFSNQQNIFPIRENGFLRGIENEFIINEYSINDNQYTLAPVSVNSLNDGNTFISWMNNQTGYYNIHARLCGLNQSFVSAEFNTSQNKPYNQYSPVTLTLNNDNIFMSWWVYLSSQDYDVWATVLYPNGTIFIPQFTVNQVTSSIQSNPTISLLKNGNIFTTWNSFSPGNYDIFAKIYNSNGGMIVSDFTINSNTAGNQFYPSVAVLDNDYTFFTWFGDTTGAYNFNAYDISGRICYGASPTGNDIILNQNTTNEQSYPKVIALSNTNAFVTWQSKQTGDFNVYARIFDVNLNPLCNDTLINQNITGDQSSPSPALLNDGNILITWLSSPQIYGRIFNSICNPITNEFAISQTISNKGTPTLTVLNNSDVFIAWSGDQTVNNIYGRTLSISDIYGLSHSTTGPVTTNPITSSALTSNTITTNPMTSNQLTTQSLTTSPVTTEAMTSDSLTTQSLTTSLTTRNAITSHSLTTLPVTMTTHANSSHLTGVNQSSNSTSSNKTGLYAGVAGGVGGVALLSGIGGIIAWKYFQKKKKTQQDNSINASIELESQGSPNRPQSSRPASEHPDKSRPQSLSPAVIAAQAFNPTKGEGIEDLRIRVTGNMYNKRYGLYFKVDEEEAQMITQQSGLKLSYPLGQDKMDVILGKGNFGQVRLAREENTLERAFVALKIVAGENSVNASLREGQLQARLNGSENVLPLLEYLHYLPTPEKKREIKTLLMETFGQTNLAGQDMTTQPLLLQITPLATFGNGDTFKNQLSKVTNQYLRNNLINHFAASLLTGLKNMHDKGIVHLDLKPSNLLIHTDGTIYIGDFGCSQQKDYLKGGIGDVRYFSPERLAHLRFLEKEKGQVYSVDEVAETFSGKAADSWAIGITLLEIINHDYPLDFRGVSVMLRTWNRNHYQQMLIPYLTHQQPSMQSLAQTNKGTFALIQKLLDIDPKKRIIVKDADTMASKNVDRSVNIPTLFNDLKNINDTLNISVISTNSVDSTYAEDNASPTLPYSNTLSQQYYYSGSATNVNQSTSSLNIDNEDIYGTNLKSYETMIGSYNVK